MEHLDLELTDRLATLFNGTTNFRKEVYGRRLGLRENVDMVGGHAFLSNKHFLRPIDDEVTS